MTLLAPHIKLERRDRGSGARSRCWLRALAAKPRLACHGGSGASRRGSSPRPGGPQPRGAVRTRARSPSEHWLLFSEIVQQLPIHAHKSDILLLTTQYERSKRLFLKVIGWRLDSTSAGRAAALDSARA